MTPALSSPKLRAPSAGNRSASRSQSTSAKLKESRNQVLVLAEPVTVRLGEFQKCRAAGLGLGVTVTKQGYTVLDTTRNGMMGAFNDRNRTKRINLGDTIVGLGAVSDPQQLASALADPNLLEKDVATFFLLRRADQITLTLRARKSSVSLGVELKRAGWNNNKLIVHQVYSGLFTQLGKEMCTNALVSGDQILQVGDATTPDEMVNALDNWAQNPQTDLAIRIGNGKITKAPGAITSGDGVTKTEFPGGVVYITNESKMPSVPKMPLLVVLFALLAGYMFFSGSAKFEFLRRQDPISELIISNYAQPETTGFSLNDINPTTFGDITCTSLASTFYTECDSSRGNLHCVGKKGNDKDFSCSSGWKVMEMEKTMSLVVNGHDASKKFPVILYGCSRMNRDRNVCVVAQS